ncbi:MAG: polyphosphate kinase 2 [Chitinophagaceae bacterium]|nr:polyphosphate kinase 2 [Chitinophagaceae bacterium]HQZ78568.1 polyphosphate kinase 2 [Bacteroidia bacterium]
MAKKISKKAVNNNDKKSDTKVLPQVDTLTTTQESGESKYAAERNAPVKKNVSSKKSDSISFRELKKLLSTDSLPSLFNETNGTLKKLLAVIKYEKELELLQIELVKMQQWVQQEGKRIVIIFEGRDAAGKGGAIRRFIEHLSPRYMRAVALPKPTEEEKGQWYFQRYTKQLPNKGEILFFDRSWYNRALVEPVNNFCTQEEYQSYMEQVKAFEQMIHSDGVTIIKLWFSITKKEQLRRFESRQKDKLKQWKISLVDLQAQEKWDEYTKYKREMFKTTSQSFSPWVIVNGNNKKTARLESIRYVLSLIPYEGKNEKILQSPFFDKTINPYKFKENVENNQS